MANVFGPKLGLLFNANIGEFYADNFRKFLQAIDQLIMGDVINATTVVPPSSPSPGDSYLISSTGSGAWASFPVNSIAVWDTQVTNSGTNTQNPQWVNYVPNAGWIIWNVATGALAVFNGSSWGPIAATGANFPTNTDITSMTALTDISLLGDPTTPLVLTNTATPTQSVTFSWSGTSSGGGTTVWADDLHTTLVNADGVQCGGILCSGEIICGSLNASSAISCNVFGNATPGIASTFIQNGGPNFALASGGGMQITGNSSGGTWDLDLENWPVASSATAGAASALPATPDTYILFTLNGARKKIAVYDV